MGPYDHDLGIKFPYYGIKLTEEEAQSIKENYEPHIYKTNGQTLFEYKDKEGNTQGYMIYVIWLPIDETL